MKILTSPHSLHRFWSVCAFCWLTGGLQSAVAQAPTTPGSQQPPSAATQSSDQDRVNAPDKAQGQPLAQNQSQSAKPVRTLPPRERAWEILHDGVTFNNTEKRAKAVTALGVLKGNAEAEKLATKALQDEKGDVRAAAANALGLMHASHARAALEAALDDHEPAVVLAAANSLLSLKNPDFAYDIYYGVLTGTVRTNQGVVKEQIKEQLKVLHDKKKIAELGLEQGVGFIPYGGIGYGMVKTLVKTDNSPVRAAAARKLAHDPDPASAKALVAATQDKNWLVRQAALEAIAERGDRKLVPQVKASMDDDKDEVRYTAAACVARLSALPLKPRVPATAVAAALPGN